MWLEFWKWLGELPHSNASFLGTMTGSALGLIALLIGALFNAWLNRRRDDRIRNQERRTVAAALRAELSGQSRRLLANAKVLEELKTDGKVIIPDIAQSIRVLSNVIDDIGLLDEETIEAVIDAHIVIEQYFGTMILHGGEAIDYGGTHRSVIMPSEKVSEFAK